MIINKVKRLHELTSKELKKDKWEGKRNPFNYMKVAKDFSISVPKYNLIPEEYVVLDFYDLDKERRRKIITRKDRDEIVRRFNKAEDVQEVENKKKFLKNFQEYIKRDYLLLDESSFEDFKAFVKKYEGYVAKISHSGQGKGVEVITEVDDVEAEYNRLTKNGFDVIEEISVAHPDLQLINPVGLPSIRLVTFVDKNGTPHIVSSTVSFSIDDPVVNSSRGGVKAFMDPVSGKIVTDAIASGNKVLKEHPVTKVPVKGYTIPEWSEMRDMMLEAAAQIPTVRYVGWDVSVSDRGPLLIEGNAIRPGINGVQIKVFDRVDEQFGKLDIVKQELEEARQQSS